MCSNLCCKLLLGANGSVLSRQHRRGQHRRGHIVVDSTVVESIFDANSFDASPCGADPVVKALFLPT